MTHGRGGNTGCLQPAAAAKQLIFDEDSFGDHMSLDYNSSIMMVEAFIIPVKVMESFEHQQQNATIKSYDG